jgi:hypothetical protein
MNLVATLSMVDGRLSGPNNVRRMYPTSFCSVQGVGFLTSSSTPVDYRAGDREKDKGGAGCSGGDAQNIGRKSISSSHRQSSLGRPGEDKRQITFTSVSRSTPNHSALLSPNAHGFVANATNHYFINLDGKLSTSTHFKWRKDPVFASRTRLDMHNNFVNIENYYGAVAHRVKVEFPTPTG